VNNSGDIKLAIIIPAFKAEFLRAALRSIAGQTEQDFQLYVGDDCSPAPIAEIVQEFSGELPIKYHRFEDNLGSISLVRHWERCIRMTGEPWIWVFSDDDFMGADCVAAFFEELKRTGGTHDAYRFNSVWVNGDNKPLLPANPSHPQNESGAEFLLARLRGGNASNMQELIFSREAWKAVGGIPDFPLAWASDDAFIAKLGEHRPIRTIFGPLVNWRLSGLNISGDKSNSASSSKFEASRQFM
jgi:GT2 family glycosyltransferase